jgi:chaperonin GroES
MKCEVEMLYDRLLVRVIEASNRTSGGLFVPEMALDQTPYLRAEVVEVGHGRVTQNGDVVPLMVKRADTIVFFRTGDGTQLIFPDEGGKDLLIIREAHVAMILRDLPQDTGLVNQDGKELLVTS